MTNGVSIPLLGYGVFQVPKDDTERLVGEAFQAGYRHIDTADGYGNEEGVGRAIAASDLSRDEIFVTTKLSNSDQGYESGLAAFERSRKRLGVEQVDLYLVHFPAPGRNLWADSWRALEKLYSDGVVRAIGVSNFKEPYLTRLLDVANVIPMAHQIEVHPTYQQAELQALSTSHGMVVEAYSPLGRGVDLTAGAVVDAAAAHSVSPAQVILRWHYQQERVAIPKSVTLDRIRDNVSILDFELSAGELEAISALESGLMTGEDIETFN